MLTELRPGVTVRPAQAAAFRGSRAPSWGLVMVAVAEARLVESTSVTVRPESTTTGPASSTKAVVPALVVTTGALLTGVTVTVLLAVLLGSAPSLATNEITRFVGSGARSVLL